MKKGDKLTIESKKKMSLAKIGKKRPDMVGINNPAKRIEVRKLLSLAKVGIKKSEKHRVNISLSKKGIKHSEETRFKKSVAMKGDKNHQWKGGLVNINKTIRRSLEYRLWRESVFKRDDFTCVWCKVIGGKLHADHIKPFAFYPELRFAIDNGRTLCIPCHKTTDTWGGKCVKNKLKITKP